MLVSISRALEQRDGQLGHGARVSALAEPVALRLGWDRERVRTLRTAAPLHDIGKVKVRPEVLSKPGPLTPEERRGGAAPPAAGAQLVVPLRRFHDALPYVLFHHERWDGGGYPAGLRGRAIPARGACSRGRRHVRRDDLRAGVPARADATRRRSQRSSAARARSSTRSSPSSSSRSGRRAGTPGSPRRARR